MPESHRNVTKRIQACNYLQNLEGEVDSSHVSFLHAHLGSPTAAGHGANDVDLHPVFEVQETDYGLAISARRDAGPDKYYWRITPFMLPIYTIIPRPAGRLRLHRRRCPIDDTNMIGITVIWNTDAVREAG